MSAQDDAPATVGPYEIRDRLGGGPLGEIFLAVKPGGGRDVALAWLPAEFARDLERLAGFEREVATTMRLRHPNVLQVLDRGKDGDRPYLVTEYVQGTPLAELLRRRRLPLAESLKVLKGICRGLEAAHREGIAHGSLNPRNVLVSADLRTVKVADFGLGRLESAAAFEGTVSTSLISLGTVHYMAPEQAGGHGAGDARSDLYAAGVLLYEMVTGRLPGGRLNLPSQVNAELPPELDTIVLRCLASDPGKRYGAAGELLAAAERLEDQLGLGLADELRGLTRTTTKVAGSRGVLIALAAGAVILIAAALAFVALQRPAQDPPSSEAPAEPPAAAAATTPATAGEGTGGEAPAAAMPAPTEPSRDPAAARRDRAAPSPAPAAPAPVAPEPPADPAGGAEGSPAARLRVARDQFTARLYDAALASVTQLAADPGAGAVAADALLLRGEIGEERNRAEEAMAAYVELRSRYPESPAAAEGGYRLGQLWRASSDRQRQSQARPVFHEVAAAYPASPWAAKALAAAAVIETESKLTLRDDRLGAAVPAALVTLRRLVESQPAAAEAEDAYWRLSELYEKLKRFDLAAQSLADLGTRFPATRHDAWWLAGQIYEKRLDRPADALEAYRRVPAGSPHHDDAAKRIAKLSR